MHDTIRKPQRAHRWSCSTSSATVFTLSLTLLAAQPALALITGDVGNAPLDDPGWPTGAAAVFNVAQRVAWWEGPPFGGGQWHAECRGDAVAFNRALAKFALIDAQSKRLVVHDGVGSSFWLNPNREEDKEAAARIDWVFMVWQPESWKRLQQMPASVRPKSEGDAPVPQIDVYAGGNIDWTDVAIPEGIDVVDNRLEAHGFTVADGTVIEGAVHDIATGAPLAATMRLQFVEPQAEGGYRYTDVKTVAAAADGHWVLTSAPKGWHRIVVSADGYVPRIVGYAIFDDQPKWSSYNAGLSQAVTVSGTVTDDAGKPLEGVRVRLGDIVTEDGGTYEPLDGTELLTDKSGRFASDKVPQAAMTVWTYKDGYCRIGLGEPIETPVENVALTMVRAARIEVVVDFGNKAKPNSYLVNIEPEGGSKVGSWGGSGNVDASGFIAFENVPPGKYVLWGRPNPGGDAEQTGKVTVELAGGETTEVSLQAK
jgi:hypothetical protein